LAIPAFLSFILEKQTLRAQPVTVYRRARADCIARLQRGEPMTELALADAIDQLRRELGRAVDAARDERLQFVLSPVELCRLHNHGSRPRC
jgi:hypothetical protein